MESPSRLLERASWRTCSMAKMLLEHKPLHVAFKSSHAGYQYLDDSDFAGRGLCD